MHQKSKHTSFLFSISPIYFYSKVISTILFMTTCVTQGPGINETEIGNPPATDCKIK